MAPYAPIRLSDMIERRFSGSGPPGPIRQIGQPSSCRPPVADQGSRCEQRGDRDRQSEQIAWKYGAAQGRHEDASRYPIAFANGRSAAAGQLGAGNRVRKTMLT